MRFRMYKGEAKQIKKKLTQDQIRNLNLKIVEDYHSEIIDIIRRNEKHILVDGKIYNPLNT